MTRTEYAELVDSMEDLWGRGLLTAWENADKVFPLFERLSKADADMCVFARVTGDPKRAAYPPTPAELVALTLERTRYETPVRRLPEPKGESWAEFCRREFGEVRSLVDVVREKAGVA